MEKQETNVQLSIKEIYAKLCPRCKREVKELIKNKLSDQVVEKMVGGE